MIVNTTDKPVKVRRNKFSGLLIPVNLERDFEQYDERKVNEKKKVVCSVAAREHRLQQLPEGETKEEIESLINKIKIGTSDEDTRNRVKELLWRYHPLFSRSKWDIGRVQIPNFCHSIKLKEDAVPKRFAPYRCAQVEREVAKKFVEKMKRAGLIRESTSPWALPLMLIRKGDDPAERRPVVDCRYLNSQQICEATFLPRVDDLLDRFNGANHYISKLDCTQWYFQIPLNKESQEICSFSTPVGNYSSEVALQGDCNVPHVAQKLQMRILEHLEDAFALLDDIGIASAKLEDHLATLEEIFERLLSIGVTLRPDKLELLSNEIDFLGFTIKAGGVLKITEDKVSAVRDWPRCRTVSEVRSFLGFMNYVRRFVPKFSAMSKPLVDLAQHERMKSGDWTPEVEKAFQDLKKAVTTAPCLIIPDTSQGGLHLYTDASSYALSFVLTQDLPEGEKVLRKPCAFGSRLLRGAEKRYSIPELECLAAVWAIKKNRPYLFGKTFDLHTDSECVFHVLRRAETEPLSSRLSRFRFDVIEYSFKTHHVSGTKNWADALSRLPVVKDPETGELDYRKDEISITDPNPPPVQVDEIDIDPLWISPVTRMQALDNQVGPGFLRKQKEDPYAMKMREEIQKSPEKRVKQGQFIFKLQKDVVVAIDKHKHQRIIIPAQMIEEILIEAHSFTHEGSTKMYKELFRKYYWPNQMKSIQKFVRECFTCQTHKLNYRHVPVPLMDLPRPTHPQDVLALDVKGPLPPSRGNQYILVAVDVFSRYGWTRAVKHVDGKEVIDFLLDEVFKFGLCNVIVTDNARNLKLGVAGHTYPKLGIENRNSLPYFASSNGGVERLIGTLGSMVRCASKDEPKQWSELIGAITNKYNHSINRAIDHTPFHVHCGYEARGLNDLVLEDETVPLTDPERYLNDLKTKQEQVKKAVLGGLDSYYQRMKNDFDAKNNSQKHDFKVGQWVLMRQEALAPGESKALGAFYVGPAEIVEVTASSARIVFLLNNVERLRSVTHLRPFYRSTESENVANFTAPKRDSNELARPLNDNESEVDGAVAGVSNAVEEDDDDDDMIRQVEFAD